MRAGRHLLVTSDNFRVGGRETYLGTCLHALAETGTTASLLATTIDAGVAGLNAFADSQASGPGEYATRWKAWLERGADLIDRARPDLIWAQHYDLFPAWLLSRLHRLPLLTTFHGPLVGDGRSNDPMQSLGMTLALHRGEGVSGVSREVLEGLSSLGRDDAALLANCVALPSEGTAPRLPPRKFVLLTRRDKLEHIRQAVLLFAHYARHVRGCRLVVADGDSDFPAARRGTLRGMARQLGTGWMWQQRAALRRALHRISFIGAIHDPESAIREAEVVLGMGRVILEGIAHGRPAVLVGYREVHGIVRPENFDDFAHTNFSGRGMPGRALSAVSAELRSLDQASIESWSEMRSAVSVRRWIPDFERAAAAAQVAPATSEGDRALAMDVAAALDADANSESLFRIVAQALTARELETFYRVANG